MVNRRQLLKISALGTASFAAPLAYSVSNITMAYNTGNAIGSTSPKDLSDNAQNLDYLVNGENASYLDRKGVPRKSWKGMETDFDAVKVQRATDYAASELSRGYENPVPYAAGIVVTRVTQLIQYNADLYKAKAGTLPWTTTGTWAIDSAKLVSVGDAALRQALLTDTGSDNLAYRRSANAPSIKRIVSLMFKDKVSLKEFDGVMGDGVNDDTAGLNAASIALAAESYGAKQYLPPGKYLINSTWNLQNQALYGAGRWTDQNGGPQSRLVAGTLGMTMLQGGSYSTIQDVGINGMDLANIGLTFKPNQAAARPSARDVEIVRCRKGGLVLPGTQNGVFENVCVRLNGRGIVLANGARNNNFFGCTGEVSSGQYAGTLLAFADTSLIYLVTDTTDADYGAAVTIGGNDRNNFFGGIFERAGLPLQIQDIAGTTYPTAQLNLYGVELASDGAACIDTSLSTVGMIINMHDGALIFANSPTAGLSKGTSGRLTFLGTQWISGGDTYVNRGLTILSNNYLTLFNWSMKRRTGEVKSTSAAGYVVNADYSISTTGLYVDVGIRNDVQGNGTNSNAVLAGGIMRVTYTIASITGAGTISVGNALTGAPNVNNFASRTTVGTYTDVVDVSNVALATRATLRFSHGGGITGFTIANVSLEFL